jgi:hypothetical protein
MWGINGAKRGCAAKYMKFLYVRGTDRSSEIPIIGLDLELLIDAQQGFKEINRGYTHHLPLYIERNYVYSELNFGLLLDLFSKLEVCGGL